MKKYLAFVLALVMALSLVACGNKTAEEPSGDGDATEQSAQMHARLTEDSSISSPRLFIVMEILCLNNLPPGLFRQKSFATI